MQSSGNLESAHREDFAGRGRKKNSARPAQAVVEPQRILDLGNGLELWKVAPSALREQDVNARSMPKAMFERLAQTIARDRRLESLPLAAKTERGLEIVSGHHRVRAATAASISEMFTLVDVTGLTRSQIAAKQLAHNAIEGQDNEQLLAEIYRQIEDAESKLEAFIDARLDVEMPKVKIEGLDIEIDFKTVLLIFLPRVKERLDRALEYLRSSGQRLDGVYIAADSDYAPLEKAVRRINEEYDVRVVADIIGKMADLALEACGVSVEGPERVHLKDLFGTVYIPKEVAAVVKSALEAMLKAGDISQTNRWQALEYWASDCVAR
jgi:hypothetical protein